MKKPNKNLEVSVKVLHVSKPWVYAKSQIWQKYVVLVCIGKYEFMQEFNVEITGRGASVAPSEDAE